MPRLAKKVRTPSSRGRSADRPDNRDPGQPGRTARADARSAPAGTVEGVGPGGDVNVALVVSTLSRSKRQAVTLLGSPSSRGWPLARPTSAVEDCRCADRGRAGGFARSSGRARRPTGVSVGEPRPDPDSAPPRAAPPRPPSAPSTTARQASRSAASRQPVAPQAAVHDYVARHPQPTRIHRAVSVGLRRVPSSESRRLRSPGPWLAKHGGSRRSPLGQPVARIARRGLGRRPDHGNVEPTWAKESHGSCLVLGWGGFLGPSSSVSGRLGGPCSPAATAAVSSATRRSLYMVSYCWVRARRHLRPAPGSGCPMSPRVSGLTDSRRFGSVQDSRGGPRLLVARSVPRDLP